MLLVPGQQRQRLQRCHPLESAASPRLAPAAHWPASVVAGLWRTPNLCGGSWQVCSWNWRARHLSCVGLACAPAKHSHGPAAVRTPQEGVHQLHITTPHSQSAIPGYTQSPPLTEHPAHPAQSWHPERRQDRMPRPRSALRRGRASACECEAASTRRVLLRGAGLAPHLQSQQADLRAIAVCHTQPHPLLIHQTGHALSGLQVSCGWVRRQGLQGACGRAGAGASTAAQGWSTALLAHTPCWRTHPAGVAPLRLHGQRFAAAQQGVATKRHHRHPPVPSAGSLRPPLVRGLQGPATRHP